MNDGPVDLDAAADAVDSQQALAAFLHALVIDLERDLARPPEETAFGAGDWAHPELSGFLERWGAALADHRPDHLVDLLGTRWGPADWRALARLLLVARVYE